MCPAREKVWMEKGKRLLLLILWLMHTTVQTSLNSFVRLFWRSLIENYFFFIKGKIPFSLNSGVGFENTKKVQSSQLLNFFPKMATLRNQRKLAVVSMETHEYPRNSHSQSSSAPEITEDYMTQVSEEIEEELLRNYPRNSTEQSPA